MGMSLDSEAKTILRAIGLMCLASLMFSLNISLVKYAAVLEVRNFPESVALKNGFEAIFVRNAINIVLCLYLMKLAKKSGSMRELSPVEWKWLFFRGGIGAVSMMTLFYASTHIPLAIASIFSNSNVFFVALLAVLFLGERIGISRIISALLGFVGILFILLESLQGTGVQGRPVDYLISFMVAPLSALAYFSVRRLKGVTGNQIVFSLAIAATVLSAAAILLVGAPIPRSHEAVIALFLSAVPGIAGQYFMTWSFQTANATLVATGQYTQPVFSAFIGFMVFGQTLTPLQALGGALALGCGVLQPIWQTLQQQQERHAIKRET